MQNKCIIFFNNRQPIIVVACFVLLVLTKVNLSWKFWIVYKCIPPKVTYIYFCIVVSMIQCRFADSILLRLIIQSHMPILCKFITCLIKYRQSWIGEASNLPNWFFFLNLKYLIYRTIWSTQTIALLLLLQDVEVSFLFILFCFHTLRLYKLIMDIE